ncbi:MAG: hypothetical protein IJL98_06415 [Lachnospiraceae bacterium]|nr:hypothetical protein [Lachnospiraceae bacterium]
MKVFKLVAGILCIILSAFVVFQSCAAGLSNTLSENGEVSGSAGVIVAVFLLVGGIVMIATRTKEGKGGSIAAAVLFVLAALVGFMMAGSYSDLKIWSGLCAVLAVVNIVSAVMAKRGSKV